ncbi:MAG: tRNA guanosine(34) transglycosylase Tgt [Solitalea-like symbiont of Acarus siro]
MTKFSLVIEDKNSKARAGVIETDSGKIHTPIFMPVGTAGSVKAVYQEQLRDDIQAEIILGNTYHLYLRPGMDVINKAGGLHKFLSWGRPILTDSGGYQVFSLSKSRVINEEGVIFRSIIDGSKHNFTPEKVVNIQRNIGSNIMMAFDECTPYPCDYQYALDSMERTHRWLNRCMMEFNKTDPLYGVEQVLFPIVQGSVYKDLRKRSAEVISSYGAFGTAIGGLSVGEPISIMYDLSEYVCDILPKDSPRYLMGVGTPANILESISRGVDMMDCVMPTRTARNGMLFTKNGIINIKNEKWKYDFSPLDEGSSLFADRHYSKSYLRHLFHAKDLLSIIFQVNS